MNVRFLVTLLIFGVVLGEKFRYDGYKVYAVYPISEAQKDTLERIRVEYNYDFWTATEIMVGPKNQIEFLQLMESLELTVKMLIEDLQEQIDKNTDVAKDDEDMSWIKYYKLHQIQSWLDSLETKYPEKVKVISAGKSYEKRDLKGVKISFGAGKKSVFIEGGIHAREWISPATVTYIINELLTSQDQHFRKLAEKYDWYLFPNFNPDGYVYSHEQERMWRKNRNPNNFKECMGVDLNRNWDFKWGEVGTSSNTCFETYHGQNSFSEPESQAFSKYISSISSDMIAYISFHSFSQALLIPYAVSKEHTDNYAQLKAIGKKAMKALSRRYGTEYTVGTAPETINQLASGSSCDWVKHTFNISITYTFELRPKAGSGSQGFNLSAENIIPNCEEIMDALVEILEGIE